MRTREEHIEAAEAAIFHANSRWRDVATRAVDYAIEQGMPVAPEPVEPVVGELLTEHTRLVKGLGCERDGILGQYAGAYEAYWGMATAARTTYPTRLMFGSRIVYVPGGDS